MPELSRFFGIVIQMYYRDHQPPHFHVRYGDQKAIVSIDGLYPLGGQLTPRVYGMVIEWASIHQVELRENWDLARRQEALNKIAPLE